MRIGVVTVVHSPPAARLSTEATAVLVSPDQVHKVIQDSDAHVGHAGSVLCPETAPITPGWMERLNTIFVGWRA